MALLGGEPCGHVRKKPGPFCAHCSPWYQHEEPDAFRAFVVDQDVNFQEAMALAIEDDQVDAPIGIDTRPCTVNPIFVRQRPGAPISRDNVIEPPCGD